MMAWGNTHLTCMQGCYQTACILGIGKEILYAATDIWSRPARGNGVPWLHLNNRKVGNGVIYLPIFCQIVRIHQAR